MLVPLGGIVRGGVQLVVGIHREVNPAHIIKKADGKYDEGLDILEDYRAVMSPEQIEQIAVMAQRVEAARPPQASGSTTLLDLLRNPFNRVAVARKYKRVCKEYLRFVQRTSQLARNQAYHESTPITRIFDVPQTLAFEIERAAGPGAEMSVRFRDVKLSVGAKTSIHLQFTPSGIMTVNLGVIQVPSLIQRESGTALVPAAFGESVQVEASVEGNDASHHTRPQPNKLGRTPSVISLSGTATIFPRQKDLHCDPGKEGGAANSGDIHDEDNSGGVTYALRFDDLECQAEGDATPANDE